MSLPTPLDSLRIAPSLITQHQADLVSHATQRLTPRKIIETQTASFLTLSTIKEARD